MGLSDIFFPKFCVVCKKSGSYVCANCFTTISFDAQLICTVCNGPSLDGLTHPRCLGKYTLDGAFCATVYASAMRKLLFRLKYKPYLSDLTTFLGSLFNDSLQQNEAFMHMLRKEKPVVVPIPLSSKKLRSRGYNQAALLGKELAKAFGLDFCELLERTKDTKPFFGLKREERKEEVKDVFAMKKRVILNAVKNLPKKEDPSATPQDDKQSTFLIDDVLTTGTTLSEAAKVLKKNGFTRVWGVCLAREQ